MKEYHVKNAETGLKGLITNKAFAKFLVFDNPAILTKKGLHRKNIEINSKEKNKESGEAYHIVNMFIFINMHNQKISFSRQEVFIMKVISITYKGAI